MTALAAKLASPAAPVCDVVCCPAPRPMPWLRLAIGLFVAAQTMTIEIGVNLTPPEDLATRQLINYVMLGATVVVMLLLGGPLIADARDALRRRSISMELLFLAGIGAAMGISLQSMRLGSGPVYFDVVSVLLTVYSVGRAISRHSRQRAVEAVTSMRRIAPTARLVQTNQADAVIPAGVVRAGDVVRVNPGELIPVDGVIESGQSFVRESFLTGEIQSRALSTGDAVSAGAGVEDGTLLIRATANGDQRKLDRLVDLVERAATHPPALQRQADRFVRWFLPAVMAVALASFAYWSRAVSVEKGLYVGLAVLLIACPCAAGLATPLTLWITLSRLARLGLIAGSGDAIERFASAGSVVFDKTGTLADEKLSLFELHWLPLPGGERAGVRGKTWSDEEPATSRESSAFHVLGRTADENDSRVPFVSDDVALPPHLTSPLRGEGQERILAMIATVERGSAHPVAKLLAGLSDDESSFTLLRLRTLPARGIEGLLLDRATETTHTVRLERDAASPANVTRIGIWIDDEPVAQIDVAESLRRSASQCVIDLAARGLPSHIMTGDQSAGVATLLAPSQAQMTPQDKWQAIQSLPRPLFVGDGLNDAPALAGAYASIALASGSTLAVATASATLHGGDLSAIPMAIDLSRHAVRLIRSNLRWAVAYNLLGIALAASGWLHPVMAAVLMGVSSAVVSWRAFRDGRPSIVEVERTDHAVTEVAESTTSAANRAAVHASSVAAVSPVTRTRRFLTATRRHAKAILLASWMAQGALLIPIAGLRLSDAILVMMVFTAIAWFIAKKYRSLPAWFDMTLAMIAVGGLGMNLGWWGDLGFNSSAIGSACCSTASGVLGAPWMYVGMILLGTPAMYVLRRTPVEFAWREWCCVGPLMLGVPAMVLGMWLGSMGAHALGVNQSAATATLLDWLFMTAGMAVGMLVPHAFAQHGSGDRVIRE